MSRPDGPEGVLHLAGRGRDLVTAADGAAEWRGGASFTARVDYMGDRRVLALTAEPDPGGLTGLVGASASSGFRGVLDRVMPSDRQAGTVLYALLDDLPVTTLVSGYALSAAGAAHPRAGRAAAHPDICAGWITGGTIMVGIEEGSRSPIVTGPLCPPLEAPDDPLAWHAMDPTLGAHGMRRQRRLDLTGGDRLRVEAMFRDSHTAPDGRRTVVHEYALSAEVDPCDLRILSCTAVPRVLPWVECPAAAASAERLVGRSTDELRGWVRSELTGTSTCTHLNDMLRSLADVGVLAGHLTSSGASA